MAARIRVKASAAVLRDGALLLVEFASVNRTYYNLPGGVIDPGESAYDTLHREMLEECGATLSHIGRLLLTWEYEPQRHDGRFGDKHRIGFVFAAELAAGSEALQPSQPDPGQTGVRWVPLAELHTIELHPDIAAPLIAALGGGPTQHLVV